MRHFATLAGYLRTLSADPDEINVLVGMLRLKVTQFFRDPGTWTVIETRILPEIISRRSRQRTIKAWSAGCSTGQEGYSLAMAIAEVLESARRDWAFEVAATNIDPVALAHAGDGIYAPKQLEGLSEGRISRWMEPHSGDNFQVRPVLRRHVSFSVHDLLAGEGAFGETDLILCRNVIMFFDPDGQRRALAHLRESLAPDGFLVLGPGEFVRAELADFSIVDRPHHIYRADHRALTGRRGGATPR